MSIYTDLKECREMIGILEDIKKKEGLSKDKQKQLEVLYETEYDLEMKHERAIEQQAMKTHPHTVDPINY